MQMLTPVTVASITKAHNLDLVAFGNANLGLVLWQDGQRIPLILDLRKHEVIRCCDDFVEPHPEFAVVANYGNRYFLKGQGVCQIAHASEIKSGAVVIKEGRIYISVKYKGTTSSVRFLDVDSGRDFHADALQDAGYYDKWNVILIDDLRPISEWQQFDL